MNKIPLYIRVSSAIIGLYVFFYILFLGREILVPLAFAWILAILLNPFVNFFTRYKMNRILAIGISVVVLIIVFGGILFFIFSQASLFSESWPELKIKFNTLLTGGLTWVSDTFNVGQAEVHKWMVQQKDAGLQGASGMITETISTVSGAVVTMLLIPVYIFLFLFYKPLLLDFIAKLFSRDKHQVVTEVLNQIKSLIQNYLLGLLIEMIIVATMNSVALLIIGVKYAVLLGIIGAILNLIPYIGGIVAIALPMIMAVLTENPMSAVFVLIAYTIIQLIDNNFLVPKIVASKVRVNALISIIVVLLGGALWGVSGMFLSIPLIAIIKVVCDRVPSLQPLGLLIGDSMPDIGKAIFKFNFKKK